MKTVRGRSHWEGDFRLEKSEATFVDGGVEGDCPWRDSPCKGPVTEGAVRPMWPEGVSEVDGSGRVDRSGHREMAQDLMDCWHGFGFYSEINREPWEACKQGNDLISVAFKRISLMLRRE